MKALSLFVLSACLFFSKAQAAETYHSDILKGTDNNLIKQGGTNASASSISSKKYLFIYFSAHWCPPCRAFTPKLVEFYNKNAGNGDFELLFVSSDKDQASMDKYMTETKMPWVGLNLKSERTKQLGKQFGVEGIPCLVLLDEKDQVLASSFKGSEYLGPEVALEKYQELHKK